MDVTPCLNPLELKKAGPFLNTNATNEMIEETGRNIFCLTFDEKTIHFNLNEFRLKKIEKYVIKSAKTVNIEKLPPIRAAKYHSYRV